METYRLKNIAIVILLLLNGCLLLTVGFQELQALRAERRVEFGPGILPRVIEEFCDSDFIDQNNYVDTLIRLQQIFYLYKNEMYDEISDEELLHFMKEQFEEVCFGDLGYLEGTCLRIFAEAVRAGYRGYQASCWPRCWKLLLQKGV